MPIWKETRGAPYMTRETFLDLRGAALHQAGTSSDWRNVLECQETGGRQLDTCTGFGQARPRPRSAYRWCSSRRALSGDSVQTHVRTAQPRLGCLGARPRDAEPLPLRTCLPGCGLEQARRSSSSARGVALAPREDGVDDRDEGPHEFLSRPAIVGRECGGAASAVELVDELKDRDGPLAIVPGDWRAKHVPCDEASVPVHLFVEARVGVAVWYDEILPTLESVRGEP
mmetsp:Transcript_72807/g.195412  ORF Transcript_72807/g.195412 Transcript_72807/m.195412 type:complete len:228 (+) Transcript_72807:594-1277(+)